MARSDVVKTDSLTDQWSSASLSSIDTVHHPSIGERIILVQQMTECLLNSGQYLPDDSIQTDDCLRQVIMKMSPEERICLWLMVNSSSKPFTMANSITQSDRI